MAEAQKKLLIVDDEPALLNLASTYFQQSGYDVKGISNPSDITSALQGWKPDIILLDIIMPLNGGLETLEKIKNEPATKGMAVRIQLDRKDTIFPQ